MTPVSFLVAGCLGSSPPRKNPWVRASYESGLQGLTVTLTLREANIVNEL